MNYLVIGGGVAGLVAAHSLVHDRGVPGEAVHLVEASDRVGGCLRSASLAGQVLDAGPDALLTRRPEGIELLRSLGLRDRTATPGSGRAYLASVAGLVSYPPGLFLGVPMSPESIRETDVLSDAGRARALRGFEDSAAWGTEDVSVAQMVTRRWGEEVANRLAGPLIGAVHAGRADYLSAAVCAPQLFPGANPPAPSAPTGGGSPFVSLDGGLWQLADHLRRALDESGVTVSTDAPVNTVTPTRQGWTAAIAHRNVEADRVVLATGAPVAADLLTATTPSAAESLASIEHASVAIAIVLLAPSADFPEGSGFLVPEAEGSPSLLTACTWFDQKWPYTARPDGRIVRLSAGRHGDSRFEDRGDAELVDALVADLARLTDQALEVRAGVVTRFPGAFPQYAVGHGELVRSVQDEVRDATAGTLALCGNAYAGVGLPAVIGSARDAAAAIAPAT